MFSDQFDDSFQMRALAFFDGLFLLFSFLTLGLPKLAEMVRKIEYQKRGQKKS